MHTRLAKASENGGMGSSFEFLRTHPVPERRIKVGDVAYFVVRRNKKNIMQHLEELVPEAYEIRAANPRCAGVRESIEQFLGSVNRWGQ